MKTALRPIIIGQQRNKQCAQSNFRWVAFHQTHDRDSSCVKFEALQFYHPEDLFMGWEKIKELVWANTVSDLGAGSASCGSIGCNQILKDLRVWLLHPHEVKS